MQAVLTNWCWGGQVIGIVVVALKFRCTVYTAD